MMRILWTIQVPFNSQNVTFGLFDDSSEGTNCDEEYGIRRAGDDLIIESKEFNPRATSSLDLLLTKRDSIKAEDLTEVDSLLNTASDTCKLSNIWTSVYEALYLELSGDSLRSDISIRNLEFIAELCPTENGHIVYIARDLAARSTGRLYTDDACERRVDPRSSSRTNQAFGTHMELKPNPSSDKIYFEVRGELISSVQVYYINGYKVPIKVNLSDSKGSMDVSTLVEGMYIMTCKTETSVFTAKFLVI